MFGLTHILATSKACRQTGVNLFVTSTTEAKAAALQKKIEKLEWEIRNEVLTQDQKDNKQAKVIQLKAQIEALVSQFTGLKITKIKRTTHQ